MVMDWLFAGRHFPAVTLLAAEYQYQSSTEHEKRVRGTPSQTVATPKVRFMGGDGDE